MSLSLVLALAACDTMSSPSGRPVANESPLSQIIAANPMPFTPAERGRAVARVPTESQTEPANGPVRRDATEKIRRGTEHQRQARKYAGRHARQTA